MGRGRAKAKQTKVARELKYNSSPDWDPSRLEGELRGNGHASVPGVSNDNGGDDDVDPYASDPYAEDDDTAPPRPR